MPELVEPLDVLELAIQGLGLHPHEVLVNKADGERIAGYMVVIQDAAALVELMRRTRGISVEFVVSEVTDNVFVVYIRD